MEANKLPFINERFTNECKEFLIFVHTNIYCNDMAMNIFKKYIKEIFNPNQASFVMNGHFKTIQLEFEQPILFNSHEKTIELLKRFFNENYIKSILMECKSSGKYYLEDDSYLNLLFNITSFDNKNVTIYL